MSSQNAWKSTEGINDDLSKKFAQFSFYLVGRKVQSKLSPNTKENVKRSLRKAGIGIQTVLYISIAVVATGLTFTSLLTLTILSTLIGVNSSFLSFLWIMVFFITTLVGTGFYLGPKLKAAERKEEIEKNIHYALNHMAISSSSGLAPSEVFNSLASAEEYGEISKEARKTIRRTEILGSSLDESIEITADYSPSKRWSSILQGMTYTVEGGGDLKQYLDEQSAAAMNDFESTWDSAIKKLGLIAEVYTIVAIVFPIVAVIMFSLLATIGELPIDGILLLQLIVFGLLPILNIIFILLLESTIPELK